MRASGRSKQASCNHDAVSIINLPLTSPPPPLPPSLPPPPVRLLPTAPASSSSSLSFWVSVAPRLLSVSPQRQLLCYTPTTTSQPCSIDCWILRNSAFASSPALILAVSGPSPCPAATILPAQSAAEYERYTARTQTSTPPELELTSLHLPASHSLSLLQPLQHRGDIALHHRDTTRKRRL